MKCCELILDEAGYHIVQISHRKFMHSRILIF